MYIVNKNKYFFKVETNTLDITKLVDCVMYETNVDVYNAVKYSSEYELDDIEAYAMYVTDETISDGHNSVFNDITKYNREEFISNFEM